MNKLIHIRTTFVRQQNQNDCGIACLSMILNYAGRKTDVPRARNNILIPDSNGLSLLELRDIARKLNLNSRCVEMEADFLRKIPTPCILHMVNANGNNHFQVCYGARKKRNGYEYLMADPARQVYYLGEDELMREWISKAALYFEDLPASLNYKFKSPWYSLFSIVAFPKGLWITIPLLNICTVIFGIAISWVLQRGINYSLADKKESLIIAVIFLLLIISLFKGLFAYIRQRILIALNTAVNEQLVSRFINKIVYGSKSGNNATNHKSIKSNMGEIQKIQNAVLISIATLASDGSLILLVLAAIIYTLPSAGYPNITYIFIVCLLSIKSIPGLSFDYAHLNELSGASENLLTKELELQDGQSNMEFGEKRLLLHHKNHDHYLRFARFIAIRISKMNLLYECIGAVSVISVFALGLVKLQQQQMEYSSFMVIVILSYFITALLPKICNSLYVIAEGAEAYLQYKILHTEKT